MGKLGSTANKKTILGCKRIMHGDIVSSFHTSMVNNYCTCQCIIQEIKFSDGSQIDISRVA